MKKINKKTPFYIILPFIVIISFVLGRVIVLKYLSPLYLVHSLKDFFNDTFHLLLFDLLMLLYLIYMVARIKSRKIPYLFVEKIILTVVFTIFIELNSTWLFSIRESSGWIFAYAYMLTYIITIPFTLLILYSWIILSDKKSSKKTEQEK
jgi:hypothetical protein